MPDLTPARLAFIAALVLFVLAGRLFLLTWRQETARPWLRRVVYGALCLAGFVVVAFVPVGT